MLPCPRDAKRCAGRCAQNIGRHHGIFEQALIACARNGKRRANKQGGNHARKAHVKCDVRGHIGIACARAQQRVRKDSHHVAWRYARAARAKRKHEQHHKRCAACNGQHGIDLAVSEVRGSAALLCGYCSLAAV